jgi:phage terminase Nu1 subunit (DNA packaging protein)
MTTTDKKEMDSPFSSFFTDKHMTREQLASVLDISIRTLDRWHARRNGPPRIKQGKLILYRTDSVDKWLQSRESQIVR